MWQDKKNIAIALTFSVLALLTFWSIDTGVWADEFAPPPGPPPSGNVGLNFLSNPLNTDLDLNNNNIFSANEIHTNSLVMSTGHLDITSMGVIPNDPANQEKWAFKGNAGRNSSATGHTYGFYGRTVSNSSNNPSYAVYGESNNTGGIAIYGKANNGYAIYGESTNINTPGVYGYGKNGVVGQSSMTGGAGIYGSAVSGSYAGFFNGQVRLDAGGYLYAHTTGNTSPIIGVAAYNGNNAGVQGYGKVGVFGSGDSVGIYGYGEIGTLAKGLRDISVVPPDDGIDPFDPGGYESGNIITKLFGINKTQAAVGNYNAYTIGLIAAGGSNYGTLTHAGLGLCAVSGAKDFALGANPDYFAYCQDTNEKNNYAGFFGGDIYIKEGSIQLNGALAASNENLFYANASSAVNNSHLLKLQVNFADKFKVDKDGAIWSASGLTTNDDININAGSLLFNDGASYIDFRGGASGPSCKAGEEGRVYYFTNYNALCLCQGASGWVTLVPGQPNGYCTNGGYDTP